MFAWQRRCSTHLRRIPSVGCKKEDLGCVEGPGPIQVAMEPDASGSWKTTFLETGGLHVCGPINKNQGFKFKSKPPIQQSLDLPVPRRQTKRVQIQIETNPNHRGVYHEAPVLSPGTVTQGVGNELFPASLKGNQIGDGFCRGHSVSHSLPTWMSDSPS